MTSAITKKILRCWWIVACLLLYYTGTATSLQSVSLEVDSFAKFPLDVSDDVTMMTATNKTRSRKEVREIRASFTPASSDGVLLYLIMGSGRSWISVGVHERKMHLLIGKNGAKTTRISLDDDIIHMGKLHSITINKINLQLTVKLSTDRTTTIRLPSVFRNSFTIMRDSAAYLGLPLKRSGERLLSSTVVACVHRVAINNRYILIPEGATESHNIKPCSIETGVDCGENYCAADGICEKTVNCNNAVSVEEITIDGKETMTKNSQYHDIVINNTVQWLQFRFDHLVYINAISGHYHTSSNRTRSHGNTQLLKFYVQFGSDGKHHNYTTNRAIKVFNMTSRWHSHHLAWPVASRSMKIQLINPPIGSGRLTIGITGCSHVDFVQTAHGFLPSLRWTLVFQSRNVFDSINEAWLEYGVANEKSLVNADQDMLNPSQTQKGKLIDIIPAFNRDRLAVRVEAWHRTSLEVVASWSLVLSDCHENFDKFTLLREIEEANFLGNNQDQQRIDRTTSQCSWAKRSFTSTNATKRDLIVRVLMHRSFAPEDAFNWLINVKIDDSTTSASHRVNSPSQCADICLKKSEPICTGFDLSAASFSTTVTSASSFECRLATRDLRHGQKLLEYHPIYNTYVVSESFRSHLPLPQENNQVKFSALPDLGYQCQCVNQMIGARCDNNSFHDCTYHVIITSPSEEIELDCRVANKSSVIGVEYAQLGISVSELSSFDPFNLHDVTIDALTLTKALCDGLEFCSLTIDRLSSLLPPANYSYLEVRFVCGDLTKAIVSLHPVTALSKLSMQNSATRTMVEERNFTTNTEPPTTTSSTMEGSGVCAHCSSRGDVKVYEKQENVGADESLFLLDLQQIGDALTTSTTYFSSTSARTSQSPREATSDAGTVANMTSTSLTQATTTQTSPISEVTTKSNQKLDVQTAYYKTASIEGVYLCTETLVHGIWFPKSNVGLVKARCPNGTTGVVTWSCLSGGDWSRDPPDTGECISDATLAVSNLIDDALSGNSADVTASTIAKRQSTALSSIADNEILPGDITKNIHIVGKILQLGMHATSNKRNQSRSEIIEESEQLTESIHATVDSLLDGTLHDAWDSIPENNRTSAAYDVTQALDDVGFLLAENLQEENTRVKYMKNTAFQVVSIRNTTSSSKENRLSFPSQPSNANDNSWILGAGNIAVPFQRSNTEQQSDFVFAVYKNLDQLLGNEYGNPAGPVTLGATNSKGKEHLGPTPSAPAVINSYVISASAKPVTLDLFHKEKINIVLRHKQASLNNTRCVFWKANKSNSSGDSNNAGGYWSGEGCVKLHSNRTHTVCECNHLTNFAILMDVVGTQLSVRDENALTVITWLGCSMSVTCLLMCLFCFNALHGLKSIRNSIHKNLCFTLTLAQVTFLLGVDRTDYPFLCPIIAGILHYIFLVVFCWMCMEGLHIYVSLVKVFEIDKSSRLVCYYLFSYGVPAIVVTVSAAVRYDGYGTDASCWLAAGDDYLIWSFVGPALCVIVVNFYFFCMALRVMSAHRITTPAYQTRLAKTRMWIKGSSVLLCLLGITWVFGVFYVGKKSVAMAYVFTVCNSLQGVFIFIFHCLLNERVRGELTKYFRRSRCCPACMRRRYHVTTSSLNTRSAYVTTGSMGFKRRRSSSSYPDTVSTVSRSWYQQTPDYDTAKLGKEVVERRQTPHWKKKPSEHAKTVTRPQHKTLDLTIVNRAAFENTKAVDGTEEVAAQTPQTERKPQAVDDECNRLPTPSSDGDVDFCSGNGVTANVTPAEERKERIERFYRDYAKHFGEANAEGRDCIFRNNSMPVKGRRDAMKATATRHVRQDASSLFLSMDLSVQLHTTRSDANT